VTTAMADPESGVFPQECARCGGAGGGPGPIDTGLTAYRYVYALGRIGARFPNESIEKEFAQATGRSETANLTDRKAFHAVISKPENRYLIRQLCWVLSIEGIETYILQPRAEADFQLLVDAVRPTPRSTDVDVVIGLLGPIVSPQFCNGLLVPIVVFDQLYSFDVDGLVKSVPAPKDLPEKQLSQFRESAEELFMRIAQMADNAGAMDEDRARNYLLVRHPAIYALAAEMHHRNFSLTAVEARPSARSGTRKVVEVIFCYNNRTTDVSEKHFIRVDVTQEFPFLASKMAPYIDR
jgi:PatG Domain